MSKETKALVPTDEKASQDAEQDESQAVKKSMNPWPLLLGLLVLAILAGGGYLAYPQIEKFLTRLDVVEADLGRINAQLASSDVSDRLGSLDNRISQLSSEMSRLDVQKRRLDTLEEAVQASHDLVNRGQREWVIAEVDYLIRIANQRLRLMRDYNGAIAALQSADHRLHELADPSLMPVREILADDIQTLKDFERPDLIGIALRLDRLISHLRPLPLDVPAQEGAPEPVQPSAEAEPGLKGMLNAAWDKLSERVTVRRYEEGVAALPDKEGELMMNQLLRLRLEAARVDVLRQDDHDFHQQLQSALDMLDQYYQEEQAVELKTELKELNSINLRPELPDITLSLKRLQRLNNRPQAKDSDA
jgi:uroporphyrin-3 C-methyltransferase